MARQPHANVPYFLCRFWTSEPALIGSRLVSFSSNYSKDFDNNNMEKLFFACMQ